MLRLDSERRPRQLREQSTDGQAGIKPARYHPYMANRASWGARIMRVTDYIHAHVGDDIEPEVLADIAGMSLHHFHRVFRGLVGESVMGFVRRLRLERAAQRLRFDDAPVTEVALDAGYGSHEAFTRAFRLRFGDSPSGYRSKSRVEVPPPEVVMRTLPESRCLTFRRLGCYEECHEAWNDLMGKLAMAGRVMDVELSLGLCYDDPDVTSTDKLRYDACVTLTRLPATLPEGCRWRTIPAGRYAIATHHGPYESIFETYVGLIGRYLPFHDIELVNEPVVENYLNNPTDTAPADLRTEVCVRVA